MKVSNIILGENVEIHETTSVNNVVIGNNVRIAKRCSIFGSEKHPLIIGKNSYIGMNSILNGYAGQMTIGSHVSIAQNVNIMVDSGPNASDLLQKIFSTTIGQVQIGSHSWIGASAIIMPNVHIGKFCVVAANSFVTQSFDDFSIIGGTPAKLIRHLTEEEKKKLLEES
jgi:acetyltransferase-like isoleucine patch superfamily enzyme